MQDARANGLLRSTPGAVDIVYEDGAVRMGDGSTALLIRGPDELLIELVAASR